MGIPPFFFTGRIRTSTVYLSVPRIHSVGYSMNSERPQSVYKCVCVKYDLPKRILQCLTSKNDRTTQDKYFNIVLVGVSVVVVGTSIGDSEILCLSVVRVGKVVFPNPH